LGVKIKCITKRVFDPERNIEYTRRILRIPKSRVRAVENKVVPKKVIKAREKTIKPVEVPKKPTRQFFLKNIKYKILEKYSHEDLWWIARKKFPRSKTICFYHQENGAVKSWCKYPPSFACLLGDVDDQEKAGKKIKCFFGVIHIGSKKNKNKPIIRKVSKTKT